MYCTGNGAHDGTCPPPAPHTPPPNPAPAARSTTHHRRYGAPPHQHIFVTGAANGKGCPQRDLDAQIKAVTHRRRHGLGEAILRPGGGIDNLPAHLNPVDRQHHLLRDSFRGNEDRTQAFMAAHHPPAPPQRRHIHIPTQPQRNRHVVHRRRTLQLIDEPQPGLRKRQRHHHRTLLHHQRRHHPTPSMTADPPTQPRHRRASNTARTDRSAPTAAFTAVINRIADSESPPRSKKESSTPTRSSPRTWA